MIENYEVTKVTKETKKIFIENENFITIQHRENGRTMYTAFIGKGEGNTDKKSIKISPMGGIMVIKQMAGNAVLNAIHLLQQDSYNYVISNSVFINLYNKEKSYMIAEL